MTVVSSRCQQWTDGLVRATSDVAKQALSIPGGCVVKGEIEKLSLQTSGAYIALLSPEVQLQIGIAADRAGCRQLAGALMMMEPDDPDLDDSVIADGFGEIVNILGGALKGVMEPSFRGLTLGLPTMIHGHIAPNPSQELQVTHVKLGETDTYLVVMINKV